jgi:16S rRNA processing protein RimM
VVAEELVKVGRIGRPHGLHGRVRVQVYSGEGDLTPGASVYLSREGEAPSDLPRRVTSVAPANGGFVLVTLEDISTPEAAADLRDATVWMARADLRPLEAGAYYVADLIGLRVETVAGDVLGKLIDVLETGTADVYVVHGPRGEVLLPATREVVREVDLARGRMVVAPLPGMVE